MKQVAAQSAAGSQPRWDAATESGGLTKQQPFKGKAKVDHTNDHTIYYINS